MNQSRAFLTSLIFAITGMGLVYFYVTEQETAIKSEFGDEVSVVVAARDINEFEQFDAKSLSIRNIPKSFVQPGSIEDVSALLSSGSVAAAPLRKGEQVLMTKVLLKGAETGLASQIAITRRALSIPVTDETGVTRLIKPGDRVDIVSPVSYQMPGGAQETEVKTILQDINVLAVGEVVQNQIPSIFETDPLTGSKRAVNLRGSRNFSTVTVEVMPLEAQSVIFILNSGAPLYMTLRNPVDRQVASIATTTVEEVLGQNSKRAQRVRPPAPAPVAAPVRTVAPAYDPFKQSGGALFQSGGSLAK